MHKILDKITMSTWCTSVFNSYTWQMLSWYWSKHIPKKVTESIISENMNSPDSGFGSSCSLKDLNTEAVTGGGLWKRYS